MFRIIYEIFKIFVLCCVYDGPLYSDLRLRKTLLRDHGPQ